MNDLTFTAEITSEKKYLITYSLLDLLYPSLKKEANLDKSLYTGSIVETIVNPGNIILEFANIDMKLFSDLLPHFVAKIDSEKLLLNYKEESAYDRLPSYTDLLLNNLSRIYKIFNNSFPGISDIIKTLICNEFCTKFISDKQFYEKVQNEFTQSVYTHCLAFIEDIKYLCTDFLIKNNFKDCILSLPQDIRVELYIDKKQQLRQKYFVKGCNSLILFDAMHFLENNVNVSTCQNCGRYFIPTVRSDEIYCDNIFRNGKTCKQLGYEVKLKNDAFKSAYRTAYKTQRARIKYNAHRPDYEEKCFIPWNTAAKEALAEFQGNNDLDGFKKWLKDNKDKYK